jgi:type I restriction enzyme S subunit
MSFPRYSSYKDSGVEWLGEVPKHWEVLPLYSSVVERAESNKGMLEDNLLSLSYGRIVKKDITSNDGLLPDSFETYQIVRPGDIVFRLTDLQNDKRSLRSALVDETGIITSAYLAVTPCGTSSDYLSYLFRSYDTTKVFYSMGGGLRQSMKFTDLKRMPTLMPTLPEQTQIAAFLDRETAKIDELVEEQRRLMELLKEKRQAVISHTVTKGLDPHVPMKHSGIEGNIDIPENWEMLYVGRLIEKAELGENYASAEGNEGVPVIKMGNLDRGFVKLDKVEYLIEDEIVSESMVLKEGDFLFNTRNSLDLVGKVAIWRGELSRATYNSNILRITFNSQKVATSAYMNYFFNSDLGLSQLRSLAKGTTSVAAVYWKDLTSFRVLLPPPAEQQEIVALLDNSCAQFDRLIADTQCAIDLLQERRNALISAAVTGKIDVRNVPSKDHV